MDIAGSKKRYNELELEQKTDFLIRFAHGLTIAGRDSYEIDSDGLKHPKLLRYINEMQHRVLGVLMDNRLGERDMKTSDWIVDLMLVHDSAMMKTHSSWAFEHAMDAVSVS